MVQDTRGNCKQRARFGPNTRGNCSKQSARIGVGYPWLLLNAEGTKWAKHPWQLQPPIARHLSGHIWAAKIRLQSDGAIWLDWRV